MYQSLFKKLNLKKIQNLTLLSITYWISCLTQKAYIRLYPAFLSIEPLNFCNLHCPECPVGNGSLARKKQLLNIKDFQKIVDKLPDTVIWLNLYFQGEPFLHPQFAEMVKISNEKGIFTSTSTNGHFLHNKEEVKNLIFSGLGKLIISIDGTTQEIYETYRKNGNLQQVIDGIKTLVSLKGELNSKTPFVEIQFLVTKHNEHQISEIKHLAKSLEVDKLSLKSTQVYDFEQGNELIPKNKKYSRYTQDKDGKYRIKKHLKNRCWRQWSGTVITSAGEVLPCCYDKNAQYSFGNLFENSFKEIWFGKKANAFCQTILSNRKGIDICNNCQ